MEIRNKSAKLDANDGGPNQMSALSISDFSALSPDRQDFS